MHAAKAINAGDNASKLSSRQTAKAIDAAIT
jgi:hypothetical protein